ncbi:hypothetical protein F5887DRAFT_1061706 [Amanita rubescens]|nr:hypothetical protein F5887DRAFT_1061706 [Amanita rubescens]
MFGSNITSSWANPQQNPQQQPSAFGFGSGTSAFGQNPQQQPAANPMFGNLAGNTGFGTRLDSRNPNPTDSTTRPGAFSSGTSTQNPPGFGAFGGAKPATGFGAFGGGGSTFGGGTFGQPSTSQTGAASTNMFGQPSSTPSAFGSGGGIFGAKPTSTFGSTATGAQPTPPVITTGTSNPPYQAHTDKDATSNVTLQYQAITCMPAYSGYSFEELRLQDYMQNRKTAGSTQPSTGVYGPQQPQQTTQPSAFGATTSAPSTGFGAFGQNTGTNTTGGGMFGGFGSQQQQPQQQPAQSAFGSFGSQTQPQQQTGGAFGSTTGAFSSAAKPAFGSFGGAGGAFGSFGAQQQQQQQQQPQGQQPSVFGGGSLFGQQQQTQPQQGAQPGSKPTTQPSTGISSKQQPQQQPTTQPSSFGLFGVKTTTPQTGGGLFGQPTAPTTTQPSLFGNAQQSTLGGGGLFGAKPAAPTLGMTQSTGQNGGLFVSSDLPLSSLLPPGPRLINLDQTQPKKKTGFFADIPTRSPVPRVQLGYTPASSKLRGFTAMSLTSGKIGALSISKETKGAAGPDSFIRSSSPSLGSSTRQSVKKVVLDKKIDPAQIFSKSGSPSLLKGSKVTFSPQLSVAIREKDAASAALPQTQLTPSPTPRAQRTPNKFTAHTRDGSQADGVDTDALDDGDYYVKPDLSALKKLGYDELSSFEGTCVHFLEPVDLTGLAKLGALLGEVIRFEDKECSVYPDSEDAEKPPPGSGLNVKATLGLLRCWAVDKATREPIKDPSHLAAVKHLKRLKSMKDTHFEGFDIEEGKWTFTVDHF